MNQLIFKVDKGKLTLQSSEHIASGDKDTDVCVFEFGPEWSKYTKTAVFGLDTTEASELKPVLVVDNSCNIPEVAMVEKGKLNIGVWGVDGNGKRISTNFAVYTIVDGAYKPDTPEYADPEPTLYEQILSMISNIEAGTTKWITTDDFGDGCSTTATNGATAIGGVDNTDKGTDNFVWGTNNKASGYHSVTLGYGNTTDGSHNLNTGLNNTANGQANAVFGQENTVHEGSGQSLVSGYKNENTGYGNIVAGENNINSGGTNAVFGDGNENNGYYNFIAGLGNSNEGNWNTLSGVGNKATGTYYGIAMGDGNEISSSNRGNACQMAIGRNNVSKGTFSIALGLANKTNGYGNASVGVSNETYGDHDYAVGSGNKIGYVDAEGNETSVSTCAAFGIGNEISKGPFNTTFGRGNKESGSNSFIGGHSNSNDADSVTIVGRGNKNYTDENNKNEYGYQITPYMSTLIGEGLSNSTPEATVLGRYNKEDPDADLIIGVGRSDYDRTNGLVLKNGNLYVYDKKVEESIPKLEGTQEEPIILSEISQSGWYILQGQYKFNRDQTELQTGNDYLTYIDVGLDIVRFVNSGDVKDTSRNRADGTVIDGTVYHNELNYLLSNYASKGFVNQSVADAVGDINTALEAIITKIDESGVLD